MEKIKHLLCVSAILIIIGCFCSCGDDKEEIQLNVSTEQLNFTGGGTSQSFNITANVGWTVSSKQEWCTLSPSTGSGNGTVTVTVGNNNSTAQRTTVITVRDSGNSLSRAIEVTQAAGKTEDPSTDPDGHSLNTDASQLEFLNSGGTKSFNVTANVVWTVISDQTWLTVSPSSGTGNSSVSLTAAANTGTVNRIARVTVSNSQYSLSKQIVVTQASIEPSIVISPITKEVVADGATFDIAVSANVEIEVTPNASWITVVQETASAVTLKADANTSTENRTGSVTFMQKNGTLSAVLTVTQAGKKTDPDKPTNVFYVSNTLGSDDNNGLSWNTAKKTINAAINAATTGDQVWVDDATYQEQIIPKAGVNVYGGFNRSEKSISERKSKTVILRNGVSQAGLATAIVIDGFRFTSLTSSFTIRKNLTLNNCEILDNTANPALIVDGGTVSRSTINNPISIGNEGMVINSYLTMGIRATTSTPAYGVTINGKNTRIEGCIIDCTCNHVSTTYTPAIRYGGIYVNNTGNEIINCTFRMKNSSAELSKAYFYGIYGSTANIANCIVLPLPGNGTPIYSSLNYITNTISTDNYSTGRDNIQIAMENLYYLNSDYSPKSNSPAVNAGDNSFVTTTTDIFGNPRIRGGKVDIGAIESSY